MSSSDIQPGLLRKMTVRKVLESLQQWGPMSRADLTRETGISAPTISKAVSDLLTSGIVEEGVAPDNVLGRPGKKLQLARESAQVIGIVLSPEVVDIMPASLDGVTIPQNRMTIPTPGSYQGLAAVLQDACGDIIASSAATTLGIGISTPGLINEATGRSVFSPNMHMIDRQQPAADIESRTGIPTVSMQESRALCLAERLFGQARGLDDFAMLDVTTGLGLGIFSDGSLVLGQNGFAGELGHLTVDPAGRLCGCGNHGCLETLATDTAFATAVSERVGRKMAMREVLDEIHNGELRADGELNRACEYLAIAMAATIHLFNPATLFVYGKLLSVHASTFEQVIRMTRRRTLDACFDSCKIELATSNKALGAVSAIVHHLTRAAGPRVAD